jgi:hypothetical protein
MTIHRGLTIGCLFMTQLGCATASDSDNLLCSKGEAHEAVAEAWEPRKKQCFGVRWTAPDRFRARPSRPIGGELTLTINGSAAAASR